MTKPIRIELPTPFSIGSVNAWLFLEPEPVLVDCGQRTPDCIEALEAGLAAEGLAISDLKKIVMTHAHVDHVGLAGYLAERCDAEFWVSDYAWEWVGDIEKKWAERVDFMFSTVRKAGVSEEFAHKLVEGMRSISQIWGSVPYDRMVRFNAKTKLNMGGTRWDVLYAPGHCESQTCFYEPNSKILISADMLLHIAPVPVIERETNLSEDGEPIRTGGLPLFMKSLERFYDLEISAVLPGHGPEFKDSHRTVIDRQRDRIGVRKEQCYDLIVGGKQTPMEITNVMYSHFPDSSKITGLAMVIGYTDLLMEEGRLMLEEIEGAWHFSPA